MSTATATPTKRAVKTRARISGAIKNHRGVKTAKRKVNEHGLTAAEQELVGDPNFGEAVGPEEGAAIADLFSGLEDKRAGLKDGDDISDDESDRVLCAILLASGFFAFFP
jgi:hypothetical protein